MWLLDFVLGGNIRIAAKNTASIFNDGLRMYGSEKYAFRYLYIVGHTFIRKYSKSEKDLYVASLFQYGLMFNCTFITIANLSTGAAPESTLFEQTYDDFNEQTSKYLRKFCIPEQYITGDNINAIKHIITFINEHGVVPESMRDQLVMFEG
jgi:hypothetical protein